MSDASSRELEELRHRLAEVTAERDAVAADNELLKLRVKQLAARL